MFVREVLVVNAAIDRSCGFPERLKRFETVRSNTQTRESTLRWTSLNGGGPHIK